LLLAGLALLAQLFGADWVRWWQERPIAGQQTPGSALAVDKTGQRVRVRYLVYLPSNYSSSEKFPLLLYLHGSGRRGDDLSLLEKEGPPRLLAQGKSFPIVVVSPQCADKARWDSRLLLDLLKQLKDKFSIDSTRIYVAGYSMGGFGTWDLITAAPSDFAAAVPVAGGGDPVSAARILEIPIWCFHGAHDKVVPLEADQKIMGAIRAAGGNRGRLTVLENDGHGICDAVFGRSDLYEWLLQQHRDASP
jgi:predicted peptidase